MLADYVRTGTYQKAIYDNSIDFRDKVVLDVGTGTGILAFFAIQAGAKMVYAVDASNSVKVAKALSLSNKYQDRITIIKGRIEEIELPEKVDVIISEPIGFLLVHERMLESYVVARDRFLKPGGLMMPTTGDVQHDCLPYLILNCIITHTGSIILCPFSDDTLYKEQLARVAFWDAPDFYGLDLTCLVDQAKTEYFAQPVVGESIMVLVFSYNHTPTRPIIFG
jgi:histone-arginine methyltransferase CARM1